MADPLVTNLWWMAWNLALAAVPALLATVLFRPGRVPSPWWWALVVVFVAFLPNAAYVLTDVVHFIRQVRTTDSDLLIAFGLIPEFGAFFLAGFGCYVYSLVRLERWLRARGWSGPHLLGVDVTLHVLCAVGVFLGRVFRFNSWDLVTRPHRIAEVVRFPKPETIVILAATFAVLAAGSHAVRLLGRVRAPT